MTEIIQDKWRKTTQDLLPEYHEPTSKGLYDLYPGFQIGPEKINTGFDDLAFQISQYSNVIIDGYVGIFWEHFQNQLDKALIDLNKKASWYSTFDFLLPEGETDEKVQPYLGGDDPIFGTRYTGGLSDFFDINSLHNIPIQNDDKITILYGPGAGLADWDSETLLIYVDIPKNEIQFRSRAGTICNLGKSTAENPKEMYKRFYFVDWIVLNKHKKDILDRIDILVDGQRPTRPVFISGDDFRNSLSEMAHNYFRVRPWFEPGVWGGQWCLDKIPQLPKDVPNYAWSFELIVPENGLLLESDHKLLEASFDWLMYYDNEAVIGKYVESFGDEFPIRFDFLDTFDGGNLSVQCHPQLEYIREHFGETFTQDETYYILDCKPDARVYLGFRDDINPDLFRKALQQSFNAAKPVDIDQYVQSHPAKKHDLFLIPNGTIHCSGINNLVLEISATPYIFTFKMYDWMRLDLDGKPRPINIDRAFDNLRFERKGNYVRQNLISKPYVLDEGSDWRLLHIPTHPDHFYDVHRLEFSGSVKVKTNGSCHVMSLVEGDSVILKTKSSKEQRFNYAETFVIPAAAEEYELLNESGSEIKVVKAFIKEGFRLPD